MLSPNRSARRCAWWLVSLRLLTGRATAAQALALTLSFALLIAALCTAPAKAQTQTQSQSHSQSQSQSQSQARAQPAAPSTTFVMMASTTSTEQSGLFAHLLPLIQRDTGIAVRVVALGTGQALDIARRGDADMVFVHDQAAEEKFVADGHGLVRLPVMHNDFVLIGPRSDPAAARSTDATTAFKKLASSGATVISRGDKSGTHAAELRLWKAAGVDLPLAPRASYKECGCGMGPALNMASSLNAYVLADRGTWANFKNRGELVVLAQGDARLHNPYGVIVVNPARHPHAKSAQAQAVADWLVSAAGQAAIAAYRVAGEQVFFPQIKR
jgi:tungstate transport system substrate-binding protein